MSDNVISIFDRLTAQKQEKVNDSPAVVLQPYHAAVNEKPGRRTYFIRIHYSNGDIEQLNYSHRKYDLSTTPERLYISFSNGIVAIKGKNIRLLLDDLQDERVRSLQPFDPAKHNPPNEGQPVIHSIEWKAVKEVKHNTSQQSE